MDKDRASAEAIVLGAGAAGLAAAATLRGAGVDVVVLERSDQVASSWRSRYDGLRLNTTAAMSTRSERRQWVTGATPRRPKQQRSRLCRAVSCPPIRGARPLRTRAFGQRQTRAESGESSPCSPPRGRAVC